MAMERTVDYDLIDLELRLSLINWSRILHDSLFNPSVSEAAKQGLVTGVLECQAFSNDFVQNVKRSSETKMKINSMLMYEIVALCCHCVVAFTSIDYLTYFVLSSVVGVYLQAA